MGKNAGEKKQEHQNVVLTYETLFDILRVEKRRDELQELDSAFLENIVLYLQQKKDMLIKKQHESGIDSFDEVKKMSIQFENVQKIVKEIYERREKKIILLALNNSRTKIIDIKKSLLLPHEEEFYRQLTMLLSAYKADIMEKAMKGQRLQEIKQEESGEQENAVLQSSSLIQVKFLEEIEEFIGPELEVYGPFSSNTVAALPLNIAEIFLSTGSAEEVRESLDNS